MEEFLVLLGSEVAPLINSLIITLIGVVFAFLGNQARRLVKRMADHEKVKEIQDSLRNNREIVQISVEYVEQIGQHLEGKAKFELAKEKALEIAQEKGANISAQELEALIEQAVLGFKQGWMSEGEDDLKEEIIDDAGVKLFKGEKIDGYDSDIHMDEE